MDKNKATIAHRMRDAAAIIKGRRAMLKASIENGLLDKGIANDDVAGIDRQADVILELADELEEIYPEQVQKIPVLETVRD